MLVILRSVLMHASFLAVIDLFTLATLNRSRKYVCFFVAFVTCFVENATN